MKDLKPHNWKHGLKRRRVYNIWSHMKSRCNNPKATSFPRYGAKGIRVCEEWNDFMTFYRDMGEPPTDKHTLDRIDGRLGYSKENCRWATYREQAINRSMTVVVNGERLPDICDKLNIDSKRVRGRLRRGNSLEKALRSTVGHEPRTHCSRGHRFSNSYVDTRGYTVQRCSICNNASQQARRSALKSKPIPEEVKG